MGQGKQGAGQEPPLSEAAFAGALIAALNRIAGAIEANAKATEKLAEATAAEFDQDGDGGLGTDLSGRTLR